MKNKTALPDETIKRMISRGKSGEKMIEELSFYIKTMEKDKDNLLTLNRKLREEYDKDEEIMKLKEYIKDLERRTFLTLNEVELKRHKEFSNKHYKSCYSRKHGSTTHIESYGVGIGTIIICKCPVCGEANDITDETSW